MWDNVCNKKLYNASALTYLMHCTIILMETELSGIKLTVLKQLTFLDHYLLL